MTRLQPATSAVAHPTTTPLQPPPLALTLALALTHTHTLTRQPQALFWDCDGVVCRGIECCAEAAFAEFPSTASLGAGGGGGPAERQRPPLVNLLMLGEMACERHAAREEQKAAQPSHGEQAEAWALAEAPIGHMTGTVGT